MTLVLSYIHVLNFMKVNNNYLSLFYLLLCSNWKAKGHPLCFPSNEDQFSEKKVRNIHKARRLLS